MNAGRLLIGATPLGQPSDASARLVTALGSADVVAAEDTRRIRTLARALDVTLAGKVVSLFDQNEASRVPSLVGDIEGTLPLNANPWRRASFMVLRAPDVPSVLFELGYLSNAEDEARFKAPDWPGPAAERVARAIEQFFGHDIAAGQ